MAEDKIKSKGRDKKKKSLDQEIEVLEGVEVKQEGNTFTFKGPKGENSRVFFNPAISIKMEGNKILLIPNKKGTKRESKSIKTFKAHMLNMMRGAKEGHTYKLKICSGHFPMNASVSGNEFVVKNFIGEKVPRKVPVKQGVTVKIEGTDVIVESVDKELAGQMAASIEEMTKRPGFDTRIFQDGIYITEKDGKAIK
jgi:large subunit ribosomal protein L6